MEANIYIRNWKAFLFCVEASIELLNGGASFGFGTAFPPRKREWKRSFLLSCHRRSGRFLQALSLSSLPIFLPRHHQLILPPPFGKFKPRRSVQQEGTARISDPQSGPSSCLSPPRTNARRRKSFSAQVRQEIRDKISKKGEIFPSESTTVDGESKLSNGLSHREGGAPPRRILFLLLSGKPLAG